MHGIFDLKIGVGDDVIDAKAFNHITKNGLSHLLSGQPPRTQSVKVATDSNKKFTNTLNFLFFYIGTETSEPPISENDIYGLTFNDLPEGYKYIEYGSTLTSVYQPIDAGEVQYVRGVGIGHFDVDGNTANNFIFSYANTSIAINNNRYPYLDNPAHAWSFQASYSLYTKSMKLPGLDLTVGGTKYRFIEATQAPALPGFASDYSQYLGISNWTGPNITSLTSAKPSFAWTVCGRPGAPSESFIEVVVEDPVTRESTRAFKVVYYNSRPFPIDITGFTYTWGAQTFYYKSDIGQHIRIPAGKRLEVVLSLDIAGGTVPRVANQFIRYDAKPTLYSGGTFAIYGYDDVKDTIIHYAQYAGTSKEYKLSINSYSGSSNASTFYSDELVAMVVEFGNGTKTAPIYVLGTKTPTSYNYSAPSIVTTDGWVLRDNKLMFAITVPAGITNIQFALTDNIWTTYTVTSGTINYIDLPVTFLYQDYMFIRWGKDSVTGLITSYFNSLVNTTEQVGVEPIIQSGERDFGLLGYPSRQTTAFPWRYSTDTAAATYTAFNRTAPGNSYAPITNNAVFATLYGVEILDTTKWFNPETKTLDAVPSFAKRILSTASGSIRVFAGSGIRRSTQSTDIVDIPFNGVPRIKSVNLVLNPTVEAPNTIVLTTLPGTHRVEVYDTSTNAVLVTLDTAPGTDYTISIVDNLYNHINYGIRYIDEDGNNQSAGLEYLFIGKELAPPDDVKVLNYSESTNTLTFTTPARATRATITRWGFELYSFETEIGGETQLYTTEILDPEGEYILNVYNSEGVTNVNPYYIFGKKPNDVAVKPTSTGPAAFADWTYSGNDYSSSGSVPFMRVDGFIDGIYKLRCDGYELAVANVKKNAAGLISEVIFANKGYILLWSTGYYENDTEYGKSSGTSYISLYAGGNGYVVVDVWHEWMLYATTGIEKLGRLNYGTWVPMYGKNSNWYQFTEISTGYVRNSAKILLRTSSNSRIPYQYDTSLTARVPYPRIFLHTNDILYSSTYNVNGSYKYNTHTPYINGVIAEWEPTYAEDGVTVIKLRCFNEEGSLTYDTANPGKGFVLDDLDESLIGDPDYINLSYTLEFYTSNKYTSTSMVGIDYNSNYINFNNPGTEHNARANVGYYYEQIFSRFYPYMPVPTWDDVMPWPITSAPFSNQINYNWSYNYRWSEAFLGNGISDDMMINSTILINGVVATVTKKEVTIPFTPTVEGIINEIQYERPVESGYSNIYRAEQVPYTYTAYVVTTPEVVISTERHPKLFSVIVDNTVRKVDTDDDPNVIHMIITRNKTLQGAFNIGYYVNSGNMYPNNAINGNNGVYINYAYIGFFTDYPKVMKTIDDKNVPEFEEINKPVLSSLYMIRYALNSVALNGLITLPEDNVIRDVFRINGQEANLTINSDWFSDPSGGDTTTLVGTLATIDGSLSIKLSGYTNIDYVGFNPGDDVLVTMSEYGSAATLGLLDAINAIYSEIPNTAQPGISAKEVYQDEYGYNLSTIWNYVAGTLPTGQQGRTMSITTTLPAPTVADVDYVVPDRTNELLAKYVSVYNNELGMYLNPLLLSEITMGETPDVQALYQHVSIYCNGVISDGYVIDQDTGYICVLFNNLDITLQFTDTGLCVCDSETGELSDSEDMYVFKFVSTYTSLVSNKQPFVFGLNNIGPDTVLEEVTWNNFASYSDVNGDVRYQTIYILTGTKPYVDVPIDPNISASVYPAFNSEVSFIYTTPRNELN